MVNNDLNRLQNELQQELINNWNQIDDNQRKNVSDLIANCKIFLENIELQVKINDLYQEKHELKKTLLAELAGGVYETYQNLIAEIEGKIKNLEEEITERNHTIIYINKEKEELEKETKKLKEDNKWLQKELKEAWSEGDTHVETMRYAYIELVAPEIEKLKREIENERNMSYEYTRELAEKIVEVENLKKKRAEDWEKSIQKSRELAEEINKRKELQSKLYLANKPLPKRPSKLKILKEKTKVKFQRLIKKTKHQSQQLIARIEVKSK